MKVLLTDGQLRKTLAAARALHQRGDQVWVAEETRAQLSGFSRACQRALLSPPPRRHDVYAKWLLRAAVEYRFDVLLPMDDHSLEAVLPHRLLVEERCLLPPTAAFSVLRDKLATVEWARKVQVRTPQTFAPRSLAEAKEVKTAWGGPLILRPTRSSGGRGIHRIDQATQLDALWPLLQRRYGRLMLQELLPLGRKFDVGLLYDRQAKLVASFAQEELRWFPHPYGASTLQTGTDRPDLVALAEQLLDGLKWVGPAEVEFLQTPDHVTCLMEVNPRPWNSWQLAIASGVNFPCLMTDLVLGRPIPALGKPRLDLTCRWLLPGDALAFMASNRRSDFRPKPWSLSDGRWIDDIIVRHDLGPVLGFICSALRYLFSRQTWRMLLRRDR